MLATEMFKVYRNISSSIFSKIFHPCDMNYNLRFNSECAVPNISSVFHGRESISYLVPKISDIVTLKLKELTSAAAFKKGSKAWKLKSCL